jgi:hypothetical protein
VPRRNHLVDLFFRKKFGGHTCFIEFYVEVGRLLFIHRAAEKKRSRKPVWSRSHPYTLGWGLGASETNRVTVSWAKGYWTGSQRREDATERLTGARRALVLVVAVLGS